MVLALDIGGTNIRSAIVQGSKLKDYRKVAMPKGKSAALKKIDEVIRGYDWKQGIGVSIAGFERGGRLQNSPNTGLEGSKITDFLKSRFKTKIKVANDADCAGLAELFFGSGRGRKNFVLLTLGTGIGGAVVIDGKLYTGRGGAGEVGSMIMLDGDIFEHHASGDASVAIARKKFRMKGITSLELEERANKGNALALKVYNRVGTYLGMGLANIAYLFDPEVLILGGGFARVKHIYPPARKALKKYYHPTPKPEVVKAKFGDDAGLIGAGLLLKK
jgi:glucokinase